MVVQFNKGRLSGWDIRFDLTFGSVRLVGIENYLIYG